MGGGWQTAKDESGNRYGKLTVIERVAGTSKSRKACAHWRCRCDCGAETISRGQDLRGGQASQCRGCRNRAGGKAIADIKRLPPGVAALHAAIAAMRQNARRRDLEWALSDDVALTLMGSDCHYCGQPPSNICKRSKSAAVYSGVDRVDSSRGYTTDNVVACCRFCNTAKSNRNVDEFREWAVWVAIKTLLRDRGGE